jgi:hypothetical protein
MNISDPTIAKLCEEDFINKAKMALDKSGGGKSFLPQLEEMAKHLAVNGIRLTYSPNWHIEQVSRNLQGI